MDTPSVKLHLDVDSRRAFADQRQASQSTTRGVNYGKEITGHRAGPGQRIMGDG